MRHLRSPIDQAIAERLINLDRAFGSIQSYGPRRCQLRFRRKIQTQRNAEFALLAVGVLLQFGAAQVGSKINIGRLDRFSHNGADGVRNLKVEETGNAFIVHCISPRTLLVAKPDRSARIACR